LRTYVNLIVGVLSTSNLPMFHQVSSTEDMTSKTEEYPSKKLKDRGKIKFESHNEEHI